MRPTTRSTGIAGLVALAAGLLFVLVAAIPASAGIPVSEIDVRESHIGATNPGFQEGECPEPPSEDLSYGWHFVIPGNSTQFDSLEVTVELEGGALYSTTEFDPGPSAVSYKHAYVFTPGPATLVSATAEVSLVPDAKQDLATVFNLSHVCPGVTPDTTVTTATTATTPPPEGATTVPSVQPQATPAPAPAPTAAVAGTTQTLPRTGSATTLLFVIGATLVAGGLLLVTLARRRSVA